MTCNQVLTADQMRAAEQRIFDAGTSVGELMEIAAGGAAEWVRRIAAGRSVTVLCGPGNNGGDGYVIARRLKQSGLKVQLVAPMAPKTDAAIAAKAAWAGDVLTSGGHAHGDVLVDCLFGSGLTRPLIAEHALLLRDLAERHTTTIAIDVPSGLVSDTGEALNDKLPHFDVTLALGAWKFAHCLADARVHMGTQRLIPIGIDRVDGAAQQVSRPVIAPPEIDAHKYTRGLCAIISGAMPGAAWIAACAAMRAGAGYVKLLGPSKLNAPAGCVCDSADVKLALADKRLRAVLVGPGLGRDEAGLEKLKAALASGRPTVLDADALHLLKPEFLSQDTPVIVTPHDGELDALCRQFAVIADGRKAKAKALAATSGMVVLAKGPDSFVASASGALAIGPAASIWLSIAGSGDALAGIIVSRMAVGAAPFDAACDALWLHAQAARLCGAAFTADDLAARVGEAMACCVTERL